MTSDSSAPARAPLAKRITLWAIRIALGLCVLLTLMVIAGQYMARQDLQERPLQVGEAVSVKNVSKGWRPGYVRSISEQGEYVIAMGATPELAARPQTDILRFQGTGRLKRRKDDSS
jgi:hypothetical protein